MSIPRDIEVEFEELDADHGGSDYPLVTDSRVQFYYLGLDWDCRVELIAVGGSAPRIRVRAYLAFLSPGDHFGRLAVGMPFLLRRGQRTIAFGRIVRLVDLEASAREARSSPGWSPDPRLAAT